MTSGKKPGRSKVARRAFLVGGVAVGGGLLVGAGVAARLACLASYKLPPKDGQFSFGAWLRIARDGRIEVAVPNHEMGQGIHSLAIILAAEGLRVPLESVHAVQAPIAPYFSSPVMMTDMLLWWDEHKEGGLPAAISWTADKLIRAAGISATGGSASTRTIAGPIRACAASALDMLMFAAAHRLGVPVDLLTASRGSISGAGKSATYGELAEVASGLSPKAVALPPLAPGTYVGRDVPRADALPKTHGTTKYGIDVREKGQLYAAIHHSPRLGGVLKSAPDGLPGVRGLVKGKDGDFVAVVASSYYHAASALSALTKDKDKNNNENKNKIVWDNSKALGISTGDVFAAYRRALDKGTAYSPRMVIDAEGHPEKAIGNAPPIKATYQVPFLAHATMEPMNATALVSDDGVKVWAGHQSSFLVQWFAARAANVSRDAVTVETHSLGGGFGRRADLGYIAKAVEIARHFKGVPVQTIWSREEDIRDDVYRPAAMVDVSAVLGKDGLPVNFIYRVAAPSVLGHFAGRILPIASRALPKDRSTVDGAIFSFYGLPNRSIEYLTVDVGVPVGFWRSVGYSFNTFFFETFIDEMAAAAGVPPIAYRERLIAAAHGGEASRRAAKVLEKLKSFDAENGLSPATKGGKVGRGISLSECFRSFVGQLADVEVVTKEDGTKEIHVDHVHAVVDCGFAIDPANVRAQVRSAINFGLSAALYGKVDIENGKIVPKNFDDYPILGPHDAPKISVEIVNSGAPLGGVGEIGTPGIAPAVGNAVFNATQERLTSLPLRPGTRQKDRSA